MVLSHETKLFRPLPFNYVAHKVLYKSQSPNLGLNAIRTVIVELMLAIEDKILKFGKNRSSGRIVLGNICLIKEDCI